MSLETQIKRALCMLCCLAFAIGSLTGCGSDGVADIVASHNKLNIQKVANAYGLYQKKKGSAVKSKEDLIAFVESGDGIQKNLEFMRIDPSEFAGMFVSERDDREFFIRWNVFVPEQTSPQPIIFETAGVDGTRLVCFSNASIEELTDDSVYEKYKTEGTKSEPETEETPVEE